jgi:hypothetical protein
VPPLMESVTGRAHSRAGLSAIEQSADQDRPHHPYSLDRDRVIQGPPMNHTIQDRDKPTVSTGLPDFVPVAEPDAGGRSRLRAATAGFPDLGSPGVVGLEFGHFAKALFKALQ